VHGTGSKQAQARELVRSPSGIRTKATRDARDPERLLRWGACWGAATGGDQVAHRGLRRAAQKYAIICATSTLLQAREF
jgi:hypothetical protein